MCTICRCKIRIEFVVNNRRYIKEKGRVRACVRAYVRASERASVRECV